MSVWVGMCCLTGPLPIPSHVANLEEYLSCQFVDKNAEVTQLSFIYPALVSLLMFEVRHALGRRRHRVTLQFGPLM